MTTTGTGRHTGKTRDARKFVAVIRLCTTQHRQSGNHTDRTTHRLPRTQQTLCKTAQTMSNTWKWGDTPLSSMLSSESVQHTNKQYQTTLTGGHTGKTRDARKFVAVIRLCTTQHRQSGKHTDRTTHRLPRTQQTLCTTAQTMSNTWKWSDTPLSSMLSSESVQHTNKQYQTTLTGGHTVVCVTLVTCCDTNKDKTRQTMTARHT